MTVTEDRLKDIYRLVNQAMIEKDVSKLGKLLLADTVLVHMTGYVQDISEWLDQIETEEMRYYSFQVDSIKDIQIEGNHASLIGQSQVKASVWRTSPNTWRLQIQMFFEKKNGEWLISKQIASIY